jgi:putative DNA primase/helicase
MEEIKTNTKESTEMPLLSVYSTKYNDSIKSKDVLSSLIQLVMPVDFLLCYYEGTDMEDYILKLRNEQQTTEDFDRKRELKDTLYRYEPKDPAKRAILVENLLGKSEQSGSKIGIINKEPYFYNGSYWELVPEDFMKDLLAMVAEKSGIKHFKATQAKYKADLYDQFLSTAIQLIPERDDSTTIINLKNGTFVFSSGSYEFREFCPDDLLTYQLPFEYDKEAQAPMFFKYLNEVVPDKASQNVMNEYIGYIFAKHLKLEKCLVLVGPGANGKSVFGDIVCALLGKRNVSSFSLSTLCESNGYYRAQMSHYLLNFCSEMGSGKVDNEMVKQLISNEPVGARSIRKDPITVTNYCRFLFNCNLLPKNVEHSHGYFRRFFYLFFDKIIPEEERIPDLAAQIIAKELPGIFNWVLEGLDRLLANKKFSYSERIANTLNKVQRESDSVALFLDDKNYISSKDKYVVSTSLYQSYSQYCQDNGYYRANNTTFLTRMEDLGFYVRRKATNNANWIYCVIKEETSSEHKATLDLVEQFVHKSKLN